MQIISQISVPRSPIPVARPRHPSPAARSPDAGGTKPSQQTASYRKSRILVTGDWRLVSGIWDLATGIGSQQRKGPSSVDYPSYLCHLAHQTRVRALAARPRLTHVCSREADVRTSLWLIRALDSRPQLTHVYSREADVHTSLWFLRALDSRLSTVDSRHLPRPASPLAP